MRFQGDYTVVDATGTVQITISAKTPSLITGKTDTQKQIILEARPERGYAATLQAGKYEMWM
jgi:hypothetical protein